MCMTIRNYKEISPSIHDGVYIDDTALVIGNVNIGAHSSVWPMCVVRGDVNWISIGSYTNIQDGTIIHVNHVSEYEPEGSTVVIGNYVTVGHRCTLHGCHINDRCLIGMNSCLMDNVVVESNVMVAAGSLVPSGKRLESGFLYLGSPAKKIRALTAKEIEHITYSAEHYAKLSI
ncbi:MAG: gamma carbonic anhydrase family protein [Coxiella sp. (in: Bacteria)]|nr:MAG: gamma carbonic anhydrase family protein [Coxiella sp. (in: g-proteobacteria)]